MKKTISILITVLLCFLLYVNTFAIEKNDEVNIGVDAIYSSKTNLEQYKGKCEDEYHIIKVKNVFQIKVLEKNKSLTLVVNVINKSEREAYDWFSKVLGKSKENLSAFEMYFIDEKGERISVSNDTEIKITNLFDNEITVFSINKNNTSKKIFDLKSNENKSFNSYTFDYIVFLDYKKLKQTTDDSSESKLTGYSNETTENISTNTNITSTKNAHNVENVDTGDSNVWLIYIATFCGSSFLFLIVIASKKKKV